MHNPSSNLTHPPPPTSTLPPLARLQDHTSSQILEALQNLRSFYWPPLLLPPKLLLLKRGIRRPIHDESVPDSGYASAEEEEQDIGDEIVVDHVTNTGNPDEEVVDDGPDNVAADLKILRSDAFERAFAIKWITGFVSRSDSWIGSSLDEDESKARARVVDYATAILSVFARGEDETVQAVTRCFSFPLHGKDGRSSIAIKVELNDAPLSNEDHTSVGLQSWASSILLAERMCTAPARFGLVTDTRTRLHVLELGAGTGLLSIVASKLLQHVNHTNSIVVATDYHQDVLENLSVNIHTNFPTSSSPPVTIHPLDWAYPGYSTLPEERFDIILAADVIYHPEHARWIKGCIERFLVQPQTGKDGGICWLIVPLRSTGRHEGMDDTVDLVFPNNFSDGVRVRATEGWTLAILEREESVRHGRVGRADESGYKLFKIGWVGIN